LRKSTTCCKLISKREQGCAAHYEQYCQHVVTALFNCNNLEQHGWQLVHSWPHNIVHACRYQLATTCAFIPCRITIRLFVSLVLRSHVCTVFFLNPPIAIFNLPYCSSQIRNYPKTLLLVSWPKIQYTRDGEGSDFMNKRWLT
jgi:hypothetical protein